MSVVAFMPYFPDREIDEKFGDFHLWNWFHGKAKYIKDAALLGYLDSYFAIYKQPDGKQEDRIAIVESAGSDILAGPPTDSALMGRFTGSVMLAHLSILPVSPNDSLFVSTPDNFIAFYQPFDLNVPGGGALEFGSYFRTTWAAGDISLLHFVTPQYVPDPKPGLRDNKLLNGLARACSMAASPDLMRLFRSLDWVRLAFNNAPEHPYPARIVAMTTAFEILLDLPATGKARYFSERLNKLLPANKLPQTTKMMGKKKTKPVSDNELGWWCREFYDLRSRVVHGDNLAPADCLTNGVDKVKIALYLFLECVRGMLTKAGITTASERAEEFWFHQKWVDIFGFPASAFF